MGSVIQMPRLSRERAARAPSRRQQIVDALESLKALHGPAWSRWKLRKKNPDERAFLIRLARNLWDVLEELPSGKRGKALEAARGKGTRLTGDANKYVTRVAVSPSRGGNPDDLVRRLTPNVARYIAVAKAVGRITGKGEEHYLGKLFRDTPIDEFSEDSQDSEGPSWALDLSILLERLCESLSRRHRLHGLFDAMYAANIHATDNSRSPEFQLSSWLSETFGEGAGGRSERLDAWYSLERMEPGLPWSGECFFVPRVRLLTEHYRLGIGPARLHKVLGSSDWEEPETAKETHAPLAFQLETWLAIVPEFAEPGEPCVTRAHFLIRPTATVVTDSPVRHVHDIAATADAIRFTVFPEGGDYDGGQWWQTTQFGALQFQQRPERFMRWFFETVAPGIDLLGIGSTRLTWHASLSPGVWWSLPVNAKNVERVLGEAGTAGALDLHFSVPDAIPGSPALEYVRDFEDSLLPTISPRLAPAGTAAFALQMHFLAQGRESTVIADLEADLLKIQQTFDRMKARVRTALDERFDRLMTELEQDQSG